VAADLQHHQKAPVMTDTELIDLCEASIKERMDNGRYPPNYMCHIGTMSFSLGTSETRTFRQLLTQAQLDQITRRLTK
jgi:hypothetical protein